MPKISAQSLDFGSAALGQRSAGHAPMADVPVGARDELDVMTACGPHGGDTPGAELAIVRMGAEADDPQFAVLRDRGGRGFAAAGLTETWTPWAGAEACLLAQPAAPATKSNMPAHRLAGNLTDLPFIV